MAHLPVPRAELTASAGPAAGVAGVAGGVGLRPVVPGPAMDLVRTLWANGHAAYVVGGSLRDALLGREPYDWDFTTDAPPERIQQLFPGAIYENRFGTVAVRRDGVEYEITTFRSDHEYADHRRPHRVEFGTSIEEDLARRDFTVNAIAWGAEAPVAPEGGAAAVEGGARAPEGAGAPAVAEDAEAPVAPEGRTAAAEGGHGAGGRHAARPRAPAESPFPEPVPALVDPFDGAADVRAHVLRAVGDPDARFHEDALRMIRAVRLAAALEFTVEPATLAAIRRQAPLADHLSGERIAAELERLLRAERPSVGLRLLQETGLLRVISPDLALQKGMAQNKIPGEDLWDHTVRAVDAPGPDRPIVRLAALLHDIGKPATETAGGYPEHGRMGAVMAEALLVRLRFPRSIVTRVGHLIRHHMFTYESAWSDAAVRRFIARIGRHALEELFELREADNVGSGLPQDAGLVELRRRVAEQLEMHVALSLQDLAIDGDDLMRELGLPEGPELGHLLETLLDQVIANSALNDRPTLLLLAQSTLGDEDDR